MDRERFEKRLRTEYFGQTLIRYEETDSTNIRAKAAAKNGAPDGAVVTAQRQTAGRGRRGRQWDSPAGKNIYMTIILRPDMEPDKAPMLTLLTACAAVRAVERACRIRGSIKWPNDIVLNGKKICGILTEMNIKDRRTEFVIVGIGVNCNQMEFPEELRQKATSLKRECGKDIEREELACLLLEELEGLYEIFEREQSLAFIKEEYEARLVNYRQRVCVLEPGGEWKGTAQGITETGELIVKDGTTGEIKTVSSGEVSVRGIYGYI